ncbi:MAG: glycosyltransferase family 1 protein, partial [Anaerolineae bacterium]
PYYLMPYRPGVTTVLTVYDLIPLLFPEHSTPRARLLFRWTTALALRAAKVVIAISEATRADFLARFRLAAERIVAIPLAADPIFRPQPADAIAAVRARYGLPERYILYLGSNKPHKNLLRLIEAWRLAITSFQLPASSLIIAGAWDARYPEPRARAEALGVGDRVRFLGPVAGADLPALYAGAALFVFPSLYEGFGLPVLEAMACGAPVVCSNVASLREVTSPPGPLSYEERGSEEASAALLVDPLDVGALADAIRRVLADPALADELRARGLAQAARFSWARTAQETLAVYRRALQAGG